MDEMSMRGISWAHEQRLRICQKRWRARFLMASIMKSPPCQQARPKVQGFLRGALPLTEVEFDLGSRTGHVIGSNMNHSEIASRNPDQS